MHREKERIDRQTHPAVRTHMRAELCGHHGRTPVSFIAGLCQEWGPILLSLSDLL
jgi:hypothetical protein